MSTPDTPSDAGQAEVHARLVGITAALVAMIRQHETTGPEHTVLSGELHQLGQRTPTAETSTVATVADVATALREDAGQP